jgi:gamma-glutamyltranspeptidase/glutathione hydrolase
MPAHRFPRAAVASPHYLASATGHAILADGGNALDAVIAANLTLGVVAPYLCGYGGDVFALVWDGEQAHGYLGSGRSPAGATREAVAGRAGTAHMPVFGPDTVTVPGAVAGWFDLLDRFGTRDFASLADDARTYARDGFPVTRAAAPVFAESARMYPEEGPWYRAWRDVYADVRAGSWLRQPALARTIDALARDGPDAYYGGPIGDAILATVTEGGSDHGRDDLRAHVGEWVAPLSAAYRDVEVLELPPPTQGVTALEALRILDGCPLPDSGPARQHLLIEVLKEALADRDAFVTDPVAMPCAATDLLDEAHVASRRQALRPDVAVHPDPGRTQPGGTAYLCAADADGLLVSLIQSNFMSFGSGVHVPDWGINLNNRGFSFSLDPAHANVFAPAKRPMHTLIPALARRDGAPWLVFGSMGGDAQTAVHLQLLVHLVDEAMDPGDALHAPRWRVDPGTWRVHGESRLGPGVFDGLRARGHDVEEGPPYDARMGHAHAIRLEHPGYAAAADPRSEGDALGR